jgi:cystathionine beta-lyase/cystathionine gamma-synthase
VEYADLSDLHLRGQRQRRKVSGDWLGPVLLRYGNLTNTAAEKAVAELEGAENALLFSSGMTAITTTVLALLKMW